MGEVLGVTGNRRAIGGCRQIGGRTLCVRPFRASRRRGGNCDREGCRSLRARAPASSALPLPAACRCRLPVLRAMRRLSGAAHALCLFLGIEAAEGYRRAGTRRFVSTRKSCRRSVWKIRCGSATRPNIPLFPEKSARFSLQAAGLSRFKIVCCSIPEAFKRSFGFPAKMLRAFRIW